MTLELLHHESLEQHPNGLRYTTFCERAFAACAQKDFDACEKGLDEAKKTDPTGETDPRVTRARAVLLRHQASVDCEKMYWVKCGEKLDLAKDLDPAGEDDADVKKMRATIAAPPTSPTGTVGVKLY